MTFGLTLGEVAALGVATASVGAGLGTALSADSPDAPRRVITPEQKEYARQLERAMAYQRGIAAPVEAANLRMLKAMPGAGFYNTAGSAAADQAFGQAAPQFQTAGLNAARMSGGPGSGRSLAAMVQGAGQLQTAQRGGALAGRLGQFQNYLGGLGATVAYGRGKLDTGLSSMGSAAQQAGERAQQNEMLRYQTALAQYQGQQALGGQLIGAGLSMGLGGLSGLGGGEGLTAATTQPGAGTYVPGAVKIPQGFGMSGFGSV